MGLIICYILSVSGLLITLIFGSIADAIPVIEFNWARIVSDCGFCLMIIPWIVVYIHSQIKK